MTRLIFAVFVMLLMSSAYYGGKTVLSNSGISPDNPLYFFDNLVEKLDIWGTKDKEKKIEKLIDFLNEKYAEAGVMLGKGDNVSAQTALKSGDTYANNALDFINNLKSDGQKTEKLTEALGGAVSAKPEILASVYQDAPPAAKSFIEEAIKKEKDETSGIIKNLDENAGKKLTSRIAQAEELISDKISQAKEMEEKQAEDALTKQERLYNIWIEHLYAVGEGEMTLVSAHIRRRHPECSGFRGKLNLFINNNFYKGLNITAGGYDDVRDTFPKFLLEKGSYKIKGELVDMKNNIISRKIIDLEI